ncbi:MAG TPA: hypothetical protein VMZ30_13065 [Pyrinomonadaceae bacterium]|nr:hypothetical protein [Pyrinomonadaceae bacterium]
MKADTRSKPAKGEPLEERFQRFAKALMAVPKKELDKEIAKDERAKLRQKKAGKHE